MSRARELAHDAGDVAELAVGAVVAGVWLGPVLGVSVAVVTVMSAAVTARKWYWSFRLAQARQRHQEALVRLHEAHAEAAVIEGVQVIAQEAAQAGDEETLRRLLPFVEGRS